MGDNYHATFLAHDYFPSKTKVELVTVRKNVNVEMSAIFQSRPSTWFKVKRKTFIQCFEHAECIAIDIFDVLGNA